MQEANIENKLAITLPIISHVERLLSKLYGQHLLHCSDALIPFIKTHTPYQFQVCNAKSGVYLPDVYSHYTLMPFRSDSIDIILTPYLMDYEKQSKMIMHEFFRILKPNGHLCIVGVPPYSDQPNGLCKTLYSHLRRLRHCYVLCRHIQQAGGVVIDKKHFFEWPQFNRFYFKHVIADCLHLLSGIIPNERHAFLIMAQKKESQIQPITIKRPIPLLTTIKIHHANR